MSTVLAATSNADSATLTTNIWPFSPNAVVSATMTNASPGPSQAIQVALQLSTDGINFTQVMLRWGVFGAGAVAFQEFELSNFIGNGTSFGGGFTPTSAWTYYRLVFSGNVGAAVTCQATDSRSHELFVVPLAGVSAATGGAIASWQFSPSGIGGVVVDRAVANITTKSTGAANLSVGVAAANTSATNLIPATAVGSAAVCLDSITTQIIASTAGESGIQDLAIAMTSTQFVNVTGSATTVGLVGTLYIHVLLPP